MIHLRSSALRGCVAAFVLMSAVEAVTRAEPAPRVRVLIQHPTIAVSSAFGLSDAGALNVRLTVTPTPTKAPVAYLLLPGSKERKPVPLAADAGTNQLQAVLGTFDGLASGRLQVEAVGKGGTLESHFASFAIAPLASGRMNTVHSLDGRLTLFMAASDSVPAQARALVFESENGDIAVPDGMTVLAGPYDVSLAGMDARIDGFVAVSLMETELSLGPALTIYGIDRRNGTSTPLDGAVDKTHFLIQAPANGFRTFAVMMKRNTK